MALVEEPSVEEPLGGNGGVERDLAGRDRVDVGVGRVASGWPMEVRQHPASARKRKIFYECLAESGAVRRAGAGPCPASFIRCCQDPLLTDPSIAGMLPRFHRPPSVGQHDLPRRHFF
jgi:hypothetical protein